MPEKIPTPGEVPIVRPGEHTESQAGYASPAEDPAVQAIERQIAERVSGAGKRARATGIDRRMIWANWVDQNPDLARQYASQHPDIARALTAWDAMQAKRTEAAGAEQPLHSLGAAAPGEIPDATTGEDELDPVTVSPNILPADLSGVQPGELRGLSESLAAGRETAPAGLAQVIDAEQARAKAVLEPAASEAPAAPAAKVDIIPPRPVETLETTEPTVVEPSSVEVPDATPVTTGSGISFKPPVPIDPEVLAHLAGEGPAESLPAAEGEPVKTPPAGEAKEPVAEVITPGRLEDYYAGRRPLSEILSPDKVGNIEARQRMLQKLLPEIEGSMPTAVKFRRVKHGQERPVIEEGWKYRGLQDGRVVIEREVDGNREVEYVNLDEFLIVNEGAVPTPTGANLDIVLAAQQNTRREIMDGIEALEEKRLAAGEARTAAVEPVEAAPPEKPEPVVLATDPETVARLQARMTERRGEKKEEAAEAEPRLTPLDIARARLAKAEYGIRKWFRPTKKKELEAARVEYQTQLSEHLDSEKARIDAEFADQDMKDQRVRDNYASRIIELRKTVDVNEEMRRVEVMRGEHESSLRGKWMEAWQKTGGRRLVLSLGMLAAGLIGGQAANQMTAGLRAATGAAGSAMLTDSAFRAFERKLVAPDISRERLETMGERELERVGIRQDIDAIEYGEGRGNKTVDKEGRETTHELGTRTHKFLLWKREDKTGKIAREIRVQKAEQRDQQLFVENRAKGIPDEETIQALFMGRLADEDWRSKETTSLLARKKIARMVTTGGSVLIGALTGWTVIESAYGVARHAADAAKATTDFQPALPDHTAVAHGKAAGKLAGQAGAKAASWLPHTETSGHTTAGAEAGAKAASWLPHTETASHAATGAEAGTATVETAKSASQLVETAETVKKGGSVWEAAADFVKHNFSHLSREQQTWMVDSIKDKIVANPELVGLKDANVVEAGHVVDFSKLDIPFPELASKATKLSAQTISSIAEHLDHPVHAAAHAASGLEGAAAVSSADAHNVVASGQSVVQPVEAPHIHLPDGTVEPLTATSQAVETGAAAATPAVETVQMAAKAVEVIPFPDQVPPELASNFNSLASSWRQLHDAGRVLDSFKSVNLQEAMAPGVLEKLLAAAKDTPDSTRVEVAQRLHDLIAKLLEHYDPKTSVEHALDWLRTHS